MLKSILGSLPLTSQQAQRLQVKSRTQLSPMLERCCLRVSANVSYQHATEDVALLTGIKVSAKTQQRLVQRQDFETMHVSEAITEVSLDGGMVRLVSPKGESSPWKQLHCRASTSEGFPV